MCEISIETEEDLNKNVLFAGFLKMKKKKTFKIFQFILDEYKQK